MNLSRSLRNRLKKHFRCSNASCGPAHIERPQLSHIFMKAWTSIVKLLEQAKHVGPSCFSVTNTYVAYFMWLAIPFNFFLLVYRFSKLNEFVTFQAQKFFLTNLLQVVRITDNFVVVMVIHSVGHGRRFLKNHTVLIDYDNEGVSKSKQQENIPLLKDAAIVFFSSLRQFQSQKYFWIL